MPGLYKEIGNNNDAVWNFFTERISDENLV